MDLINYGCIMRINANFYVHLFHGSDFNMYLFFRIREYHQFKTTIVALDEICPVPRCQRGCSLCSVDQSANRSKQFDSKDLYHFYLPFTFLAVLMILDSHKIIVASFLSFYMRCYFFILLGVTFANLLCQLIR